MKRRAELVEELSELLTLLEADEAEDWLAVVDPVVEEVVAPVDPEPPPPSPGLMSLPQLASRTKANARGASRHGWCSSSTMIPLTRRCAR